MAHLPKLGAAAWAHFILRVVSTITEIALLCVAIYMAATYGRYDTNKIYKAPIAAACVGIVVDGLGMFLLLREKETILVVGVFDFFLLILAAVSIFIINWSNWGLENYPKIPSYMWADIDPAAMALTCLMMSERFFALAFNCVGCCRYGRAHVSRANRSRSSGQRSGQRIPLSAKKASGSEGLLASESGGGLTNS